MKAYKLIKWLLKQMVNHGFHCHVSIGLDDSTLNIIEADENDWEVRPNICIFTGEERKSYLE